MLQGSVPVAMGADRRSSLSADMAAALNRAELAMQCLGACLSALNGLLSQQLHLQVMFFSS